MSTIYYFTCPDCKAVIEAGRNGRLWTGPGDSMLARDLWLQAHEGHFIVFTSEHHLPDWAERLLPE